MQHGWQAKRVVVRKDRRGAWLELVDLWKIDPRRLPLAEGEELNLPLELLFRADVGDGRLGPLAFLPVSRLTFLPGILLRPAAFASRRSNPSLLRSEVFDPI